MFLRFGVAALVLSGASPVMADVSEGRACFDTFVALEAAYDPKSVDMFDKHALIENTYVSQEPQVKSRSVVVPLKQYKAEYLAALPKLKASKHTETYSDIVVEAEGKRYRVTGIDYSSTYKTASSFSALFGVDNKGKCVIHELKMVFPISKKPS